MIYDNKQGLGADYINLPFEKASGVGSYPQSTADYCKELKNAINSNNVTGVVDYGCGNMQSYKGHIDWNTMNLPYVGYDISDICIRQLSQQYPSLRFCVSPDEMSIPQEDSLYNSLIIKDVLIHWYDHMIVEFFNNVFEKYDYVFYMHQTTNQEYTLNPTTIKHHNEYFEGYKPIKNDLLPTDKIIYSTTVFNETNKTFIVFKK